MTGGNLGQKKMTDGLTGSEDKRVESSKVNHESPPQASNYHTCRWRDPVLLVARCYREIIESRSKIPEEIVTTTTGDDLTAYDETSSTDRVAKRCKIESMASSNSVPIRNRTYQKFIDTTSTDPTDILTRKMMMMMMMISILTCMMMIYDAGIMVFTHEYKSIFKCSVVLNVL